MENVPLIDLIELLFWLVFIVGFILWAIYDSRKPDKRAESLKEFGPLPLLSSPSQVLISKIKEATGVMPLATTDNLFVRRRGFHHRALRRREVKNLMEGNIGSIDFVTFDYNYPTDPSLQGTAILLQSDQLTLPSFTTWFTPYRYGHEWSAPPMYSHERKVELLEPPRAKREAGFRQCPTCGSLEVYGGAMIEGGGIGDWCPHCKKSVCRKSLYKMNEEEVRKLFKAVSTADYLKWTISAYGTQLLLSREMVAAEKYQEFIEEALTIFQLLQSSYESLNKLT